MCSARNHHIVVDGPVQNDCPGEELTPAEVYLSAVAACGVELIHVIAKDQNAPLLCVAVLFFGFVVWANQARSDLTTFNSVQLDFTLWGVDQTQGTARVTGFQGRCPLYGTVAAATKDVRVNFSIGR